MDNLYFSKTITHNAEIKQICEDMEAQMMNEKAKQKEIVILISNYYNLYSFS